MKADKLCISCENCNKRSPLFASLSEEELQLLNADRYSVRFHEGEVILKQGTRADYLVSVIEGFAKMYIEGNQNRNLILDFIKPWKLIGGPSAQVRDKHRYSVMAIQETFVCFIDMENIKKVLASNSDFSERIMTHYSGNYLLALDRLVSISQKQMHGRVADALIYLSQEIYNSPVIGEEISRQDIADYSSISKDSAIRVLKEFERDQIILLNGRKIEVRAPDRLSEISDKG
ncbi:MAG: Crp/Fnr family transcriptional regulator [Bacteroidales bacterium]|nr:Crp/Fnr family transcriptional regulator [Bacteroidales bacterium]